MHRPVCCAERSAFGSFETPRLRHVWAHISRSLTNRFGGDLPLMSQLRFPSREQRDRTYLLNMSMKLIVPLNRACATNWDRLTAS